MTNLISQIFKNDEKKLVTFVTGGDPDFETSLQIIKTIINNGADIMEIGMPFSDPMADGPTIQLSSNRAISKGIDLENIFSLAAEAKKIKNDLPIILMGYYNLILYFGIEKFVKKCKENGVDGLIIVDLQPEEDEDLINELKNNQIDLIRLITPTTNEERLKLILNNASGFLYYVSVMGITGQKSADLNELKKSVAFIKKHTNLPVVPGFGIKNSTDVNNICKIADGAVVGSSIIKIIEENLTNKEKIVVLDSKMNFDNNALFRHKDISEMRDLDEEDPMEVEAKKFNLNKEDFTVAFQSRLGKGWIEPFSDEIIKERAKKGDKKLLIFSPAFVADCLETNIEIGVEYQEIFEEHGGEKVQLVESLNDSDTWVKCLQKMVLKRSI